MAVLSAQVMGTESLVGSTVMVEVVDGLFEQTVGGDGNVVAVQAVGLVESGKHGAFIGKLQLVFNKR